MTALLTDISVPADDGAVQRAFERLDAQMDAWLTAMKRLDAHLQTATDDQAVSETASAGSPPDIMPGQVAQVTQTAQVAAQQAKPVDQEVKPVAQAAKLDAQEAEREAAAVAEHSASSKQAASAQATSAQQNELDEKPVELDGDALLATLDEETAKDIRVMRRMSFGQRSVRELLAEYQAKKTGQKAGDQIGKSKSWWRR